MPTEFVRVGFGEPIQEPRVPERNLMEYFGGLFYQIGLITHESKIRPEIHESGQSQRPIGLREQRTELLILAHKTSDRDERKVIIAEAHIRDEIALAYLQQSEISVDLPRLGEQRARFLEIHPPKNIVNPKTAGLPPIFLIPTISADLEPMSEFIRELVRQGRTVICAGYPEATLGQVTKEYAAAAIASQDFEPHTSFFKSVVTKLIAEKYPNGMELWGYSTGAPIAAEILNDPQTQAVVTRAVFVAPAGTVDQTPSSFGAGLVNEMKYLFSKFSRIPRYTFIWGRRMPQDENQTQEKALVFKRLLEKINRHSPSWKSANVGQGGEMIMGSCWRDDLTKSRFAEKMIQQENPGIKVLAFPDAAHTTPLVEPQKFVEQLCVPSKHS